MLSCKDIVQHSSEYLDGELGFWARFHYKLHLFVCANCRRFWAHFKITVVVSADCAKHTLPPDEAERIASACQKACRHSETD